MSDEALNTLVRLLDEAISRAATHTSSGANDVGQIELLRIELQGLKTMVSESPETMRGLLASASRNTADLQREMVNLRRGMQAFMEVVSATARRLQETGENRPHPANKKSPRPKK